MTSLLSIGYLADTDFMDNKSLCAPVMQDSIFSGHFKQQLKLRQGCVCHTMIYSFNAN